jgi:hypothetical protein
VLAAACLLVTVACGGTGPDGEGLGENRNWAGLYLRANLFPRQAPELGEYSSRDPLVISRHATWASEAGIDFFAIPWRGPTSWGHTTLSDYVVDHPSFGSIDWCLIYELPTVMAGYPEASPVNLTLAARDTLLQHLLLFNDEFFWRSNYLHLNGRPVVFMRQSRRIAGDARIALNAVRIAYSDSTGGSDFYLVGDEAIWGAVGSPNASRISAMDAITGIDLAVLGSHNGYALGTGFVTDLGGVWQEYSLAGAALDPQVPLIPVVLPGYNDRASTAAVRPVISREMSSTATQQGGTYNAVWGVSSQYVGTPAVVLLNSFNDWQRETQVEPVADNSDLNGTTTPGTFTGGMRYFPYEEAFLTATSSNKGIVLLGAIYEVWYDDSPPTG